MRAHIDAMDTTLHSRGGSTSYVRPRFIAWLIRSWARRPAMRSRPTTEGWHDTVPALWSHDGTTSHCWPADRRSRNGVDATRTQRGN